MAAVDVEGLTVTYGKVTAVDDVSFQAEAGDVTCMLGPNGAGKTSTIETLEGLRRPAAGRLSVVGLDPRTEHFVLTERMGVMLQDGGIHPAVTVRAALRHAHALYENPLRVRGLIDRLGLGGLERRSYRQLSGGEQKRLALALALVGRPQVAFLDEPTSGVDPAGRQVIRRVIADLRNEGVTVLLTTHDLDEAERVADRVIVIDRGRILADGTVAELTRTPDGESRVSFRAPPGIDRAALGDRIGADVLETGPGDYTVAAPPTPPVIAAITAWLAENDLPLGDLRAGRQRLEDVYLRLTTGSGGPRRRRRPPAEPDPPARAARPDRSAGPGTGPDDRDPRAEPGPGPEPESGESDDGATPPRARTKGRITQLAPRPRGTTGRRRSGADSGSEVTSETGAAPTRASVEVIPPGGRSRPGGGAIPPDPALGPDRHPDATDAAIPPAPRLGANRDHDPDPDPTVEVIPPAPRLGANHDDDPDAAVDVIPPAPALGSASGPEPGTKAGDDDAAQLDAWFEAEPDDERDKRTADWWSPPWSDRSGGGGGSRRFRRRS